MWSSARCRVEAVRRLFTAIAVWLCAGSVLSACPICFQVEDTGVVNGVRAAVVVLGGVTGGVLVGVAVFAWRLVKAERQ